MATLNCFSHSFKTWRELVLKLLGDNVEWNHEQMLALCTELACLCVEPGSTSEEREVVETLSRISEYEKYDYLPLLSLCEKNEGFYHPVFKVTVLIHIQYMYRLKMKSLEGREKGIYQQSLTSVNHVMKQFLEGRSEYYKQSSNKQRLLKKVVEEKIVDKTEQVVEEYFWITKYIFIDLDGKSHWANSPDERDRLKGKYIDSFIENYSLIEEYKASSLYFTVIQILECI